ncbi:MAG: FAD-dependent pyridine nucleotide-disulfide oxidoreductase [Chloroflexi bacterium]|jgi:NADH dehydrogenase|nr:FAD-dependent pyridine nucleotide-disulfide oxidoreductase [Chloroflexota bacterium]
MSEQLNDTVVLNHNKTEILQDNKSLEKGQPVTKKRVDRRPKVVILGAGFGGTNAAASLSNSDMDVLVIDRNNYHGFWPLLYQVATAGLEPQSVAYPVRGLLRKYVNVDFQLNEVTGVNLENKQVITQDELIEYDYLILSAGSANSYFGNKSLARETLGLKDLDDASRLRNRLLESFELAVREQDPVKRAKLLTFVVIGGGPTGVELSGAISELIRHVLNKDYPSLDVYKARVILLEALPKILGTFRDSLQQKALHTLEKMGVEVRLGIPVETVENGRIRLKDGNEIEANTIVWAAGVRSAEIADSLGVELARQARVPVEPTLQLKDHPEVFVIGDMAYLEGFKEKQAYPMVAPVAIQMGKLAGANVLALQHNRPLAKFKYFDKGNMATIGRRNAIFDAFGIHMSGLPAWLSWLFVHLMSLVGFRNRLIVLMNWAYNYFTYDRGARLITGKKR